jgi:hypothetical protein
LRKYLLNPLLRAASALAHVLYPILPILRSKIKRPIFIVGCSRSGTSIFVDLFTRHPETANWSEASQVFELDYYNPGIDHFKDETHVAESDRRRLVVFFSLYQCLRGRQRFVNKHPQNSLRIRYLNAIFPDAIFIHVTRDPLPVVYSNMVKEKAERFRRLIPFGNFPKPRNWLELGHEAPESRFANQWLQVTSEIRRAAQEVLNPLRYIEIDYRSFCADPMAELVRLDGFCGLKPAVRRGHDIPKRLEVDDSKWRSGLSEAQIKTISSIVGARTGDADSSFAWRST